jgi:rubrerythrin
MSQTWRCPKCGAVVTTYIRVSQAPTCGHAGRYGRRVEVMVADDE